MRTHAIIAAFAAVFLVASAAARPQPPMATSTQQFNPELIKLEPGMVPLDTAVNAVLQSNPTVKALQLDPCNARKSKAPAMVLEVSQGVCTVSSRTLDKSKAASTDALQLSFPCAASGDSRTHLAGPALNLWAALSTDAAGICTVTTLNPAQFYNKKSTPTYYYGYEVSKLACKQVSGAAADNALASGSALAVSTKGKTGPQHGLWLVPSLPTPAAGAKKGFSTQAQQCKLAVTTSGRSYLSNQTYPCSLVVDPEASLGQGVCFGSPAHADK